ncbi:helix-turn-helix transcriptional regulator [Paenibacillus alvei]|uniref:Helix-turn-helix transcriptional regulator n=1 Tax=Paenibacillus alvei TaxID=44250 RepID=A0ABT4H9A0_PAEAL|nr:helix-turn-helix transcriptional regulator [Paenibacillus alvei]MCY7485420.1 helix-turn-helix transcriptional regulator [Paenibacillus alvei]MCY9544532.1 helix-turn-helix transcriptional regulator [Paenibacillus alvei]MCY9706949.1 helix-turn-helix transcriptional regulator [Paenibacillus alvei]MCY9736081.1 helix-turn-helix transcriptional regulator [Paenibacillus alvei]MCY9755855.1 helix-turn-helix transcriptional regulator [Paenibacillus alvei]
MKRAVIDTDKLVLYLDEKGMNMTSFAKKIGVSPSCVSRLLNNKREASGPVWSGLFGLMGKKAFEYIFFETVVSNDTKGGESKGDK